MSFFTQRRRVFNILHLTQRSECDNLEELQMRRRGRVGFGRIQRAAGWCEAVPEETELTLEHLTEPLDRQ